MSTEALLEETLVEGPGGRAVDGVSLTCSVCDGCVECIGYDTPDTRFKLGHMLNTQCPEKRMHKFKFLVG